MTRFTNYGFKRTSMDDIARAASVSRPTLYAYFKNKQAILLAVSEGIHEATLANIELALTSPDSLSQRLLAGFEAWTEPYTSILFGSPHGAELIGAGSAVASDISAEARARFHTLLAGCLKAAQKAGEIELKKASLSFDDAAELLILSLNGLSASGADSAAHTKRLKNLVRVFLRATAVTPG